MFPLCQCHKHTHAHAHMHTHTAYGIMCKSLLVHTKWQIKHIIWEEIVYSYFKQITKETLIYDQRRQSVGVNLWNHNSTTTPCASLHATEVCYCSLSSMHQLYKMQSQLKKMSQLTSSSNWKQNNFFCCSFFKYYRIFRVKLNTSKD